MLLAGAAPAAAAPVLSGNSGWFWGDPLPQGGQLNAIDFVGARGYAVGENGIALRTDDAGGTWTSLQPGTTTALQKVQAVDANVVIAGGGCAIRRSNDGGATFARLPFTSNEANCPAGVSGFSFPSSSVGFLLLSNGTVFRTVDGGQTFSGRAGVPDTAATGGSQIPVDVHFTTDTNGVAIAGTNVYRTIDGGGVWTLVHTGGVKLNAVDFPTPMTGYVVGDGGVVLQSVDGGGIWAPKPMTGPGGGKSYTDVACADATTCLMTTFTSPSLARTGDSGATSTLADTVGPNLRGVAFSSAARPVAVGEVGATQASNDAGVSFARIGGQLAGINGDFAQLRSAFGNRAYLAGATGKFARTLDAGRSWATIGVSTAATVLDVSFPTAFTGYVLDTTGTVLRTDNAGDSWRILETGGADPVRVLALDANRVLLIGDRGIRRSVNGTTFAPVGSKTLRKTTLTAVDLAGKGVVAYSSKVAWLSANGGAKWAKLRIPRGAIRAVDFVSAKTGFLLQRSGRLYKTSTAGRRWTEVVALGGSFPSGIAFADAKHGFAVGDGTFRTNDGGSSWQGVPLSGDSDALDGIAAPSMSGGIAFTRFPLRLFATTSGGAIGTPTTLSGKPSKRRLTRAGTVKFSGRLKPVVAGAIVTVDLRRGGKVATKRATVGAKGTYSVSFKVRGTSYAVAHWNGTGKFAGDGTLATKITVKKRR